MASNLSLKDVDDAVARLNQALLIETKIKMGAENMLRVSHSSNKGSTVPREDVLKQLARANQKIHELNRQLEQYDRIRRGESTAVRHRAESSSGGPPELRTVLSSGSMDRLDAFRRRSTPGEASRRNQANLLSGSAFSMHDVVVSLQVLPEHEGTQVECLENLIRLVQHSPHLATGVPLDTKLKAVFPYLNGSSKVVRAAAYRCLRYLSTSKAAVQLMVQQRIDLFILRTLTKETKKLVEKEQCLKLIRSWMDVPGQPVLIPKGVMRMVVAIADHPEDPLRLLVIETLCELALSSHLELLAHCGGIRSICIGLLDCPREMTEFIAMTLLFLMDSPHSRRYIRRKVDLESVVSMFSDAYSRGPTFEDKLMASSRAVSAMLHHWAGVLSLSQDDSRVIKVIVDSLRLPYQEIRMAVLNLLQSLFLFDDKEKDGEKEKESRSFAPRPEKLDLVGHSTALLLLIFIRSGLFEALIGLIGQSASEVVDRATSLIGHLIELCNQLLPEQIAVEVQSLPGLFDLASKFRRQEETRHRAIAALAHIDDSTWPEIPLPSTIRIDQVKVQMGLSMEDSQFRAMLSDSGVLMAKAREYPKWSWNIISELLQGPFLSPKRLEETMRTTKFFKRLCSFFRPSKRLFCDLPVSRINAKYIKAGAHLLTALLSSSDGVKFLEENSLLRELAVALTSLNAGRDTPEWQQILTEARLERTLSMGYFTMLGALSKCESGATLMNLFRFNSLLYHLSEILDRPDIMRILIVSLDYSREDHCRNLLSKFLTCTLPEIRLFATCHLRTLLQTAPNYDLVKWAVPLLATQLYDPSSKVYHVAVAILDEACSFEQTRQALVQMSPTLDHLGDVGNPLCLHLMSTSAGFEYLTSTGYVDHEYQFWCDTGVERYVSEIEVTLYRTYTKKLAATSPFERGKYEDFLFAGNESDDGWTIPHFFGELAKTMEGCQYLRNRGDLARYCQRLYRWETLVETNPTHLRALLWTVGNVACSKIGIALVDEQAVIPHICRLVRDCQVFTLRGTAFFTLGLIAKTPKGRDVLTTLGWQCGGEHGFCIPANLEEIIYIPEWKYMGSHPKEHADVSACANLELEDKHSREIMKNIANLSNHILLNAALKALSRMRAQHARSFQSIDLFLKVVHLMENFNFRFSARKFIIDLFDKVDYRKAPNVDSSSPDGSKAGSSSATQKKGLNHHGRKGKDGTLQSDEFDSLPRKHGPKGTKDETATHSLALALAPKTIVRGFQNA